MSRTPKQPEAPFPQVRPEVTVTPTEEPLFEVDWRELAWWSTDTELVVLRSAQGSFRRTS